MIFNYINRIYCNYNPNLRGSRLDIVAEVGQVQQYHHF